MFEVQKLKQQVYKQVQQSGLYRQVQAQLKTHVLNNLESQTSSKQSALGFSYIHPLLPKLQKYNITHICLDLIQEFLQSFKFQYTLSVFMKEVNRSGKVQREKLAKELNMETNQSVLLTAVEILRNGQVSRTKEAVYFGVPEDRRKERQREEQRWSSRDEGRYEKNEREDRYQKEKWEDSQRDKQKKKQLTKQSKKQEQERQRQRQKQKQKQRQKQRERQKEKEKQKQKQKEKQKEKQKQKQKQSVSPSPSPPPSAKPKKQQPPKTATDFLASITSKMKPKQEQPKKPVYQRAMSAPAAPMRAPPPPQTGTNKIGGLGANKQSPFAAFIKTPSSTSMSGFGITAPKDPYSYDLKSKPTPAARKKSQDDIDEEIEQFLQSRDSTRRNPLFSSTEEGLQSMGYDQSVDSNAIEDVDYYQIAKKRKK